MPTEALQKTTQNVESDAFKGIIAITKGYVEFALNNPEIARMMFCIKEWVTDPKLQKASTLAVVPIFRIRPVRKHSKAEMVKLLLLNIE